MVDYVDLKHAMSLNSRLEKFQVKSRNPYKLNFRCHICGDSKTSKSKARGWLLEDNHQSFHFYCHNCGASLSFHSFLKSIDTSLYNEFISEKYINKIKDEKAISSLLVREKLIPVKKESNNQFLSKIKNITELSDKHPVIEYINSRKIPREEHSRIFYSPKFMGWVNSMIPDKFPSIKEDEPRIIFPFLDRNGEMFGFSARGFKKDGPRYITIMLRKDEPKIFGLDRVNFGKPYKILEGAIDSFFIKNSIAMAGADGNVVGLENTQNATFVFDCEPRNKEIHKTMEKVVKSGMRICIWPPNMPGKDINEMILNGANDIESIIETNTHTGLQALLKLSEWKKT